MIPNHIMYRMFEKHGVAVVVDSQTDRMVVVQKHLFRLFKDWEAGVSMKFETLNPFGPIDSPQKASPRPTGTPVQSPPSDLPGQALSLFAAYNRIPISGHLAITKRCALHCRHCYSLKTSDELPTQTLIALLDELAEAGCLFLTLTGGEPFMRDDLLSIVQHGFKRRFLIRIDSNATLIDAGTAAFLSAFPNIRMYISLYGSSSETHDAMTRSPGSFLKTVQGIHLLKEHGVRLKMCGVITQINFSDMAAMKGMAETLNVPFDFSSDIFPRDDGSHDNTDLMIGHEKRRAFEAFMGHDPVFVQRLHAEASLCRAGLAFFAIDEKGNVRPCPKLRSTVIGNVLETPFSEIWRSDAARTMREPVEKRLCRCVPVKAFGGPAGGQTF